MNNLSKLLTFPGNGVFTVHTAREKKEKIISGYYRTTDPSKAQTYWNKELLSLDTTKPWVIGIPSDSGGGIQRGANWGPMSVRLEILDLKNELIDLGDVRTIPHLLHDKYLNEKTIKECRKALYGKNLKLPVSPLSIAEKVLSTLYKKHKEAKIFGIGGDHSTSYPLVKTWIESRKNLKKAALIHFDAHTDLLESRLGIDLCFGTWTYQILSMLYSSDHILQLGIRSSGKTKNFWKKNLGVNQFWAQEMINWGVEKTYAKISAHLKKINISEIYISFDIDALDKRYACATGTPEDNGLNPADCAAIIRLLSKDFKITGADLMEVAPYVLPGGCEKRDQQASLMVAGDLARILINVLKE